MTTVLTEEWGTHHQTEVNGIRMHYVRAGGGTPLVLLHGWPQTWFEWRRVIGPLARDYEVVVPDLRGLGDTEVPRSGYDRRTPAEDVHALMRSLGHERYGVVGHDVGAYVARNLAGFHPEAVTRLLVVEGPPGLPRAGDAIPLEAAIRLNHVFVNGGNPDHTARVALADVDTFLRRFLTALDVNYSPAVFGEDEIAEYVRAYSNPGTFRAGLEYYALGLRADTVTGGDGPIEAPTQVWFGDVFLGSLFDPVELWCPHAPRVTGGVIERCGHFVAEERPDVLIDKVRAFFPLTTSGDPA